MVRTSIAVAAALAACSGTQSAPSAPPRGDPAVVDAAAPVEAPPAPADAPAVVTVSAPSSCTADATHCCMPDGRVVAPGGCQPDYPDGVQPATERADDGSCRVIPCFKRCLPAEALIATPSGPIAASAIARGTVVWTRDARGRRVPAPVVRTIRIPIADVHPLVELTLADGRVVRGSAGHPLATGDDLGTIAIGATVDDSIVTGRRVVTYRGATWDLLPAGDTGQYWADGVLLGSTLRR